MLIELPVPWIVILNVGLWPLIQVALAWAFTRLPLLWFKPPATPASETAALYEKFFLIRRWKDLLPDGAGWVGGSFQKSRLTGSDPRYLERFVAETWRGESCHIFAFLFVPLFFLWNPWWGDCVMVAYALAANLPCILVQRYNRIRIRHLLDRPGPSILRGTE